MRRAVNRRAALGGRQRGSIMVMTAIMMLGLVLAVGLCIDVARIYMVRAELQNAADAAALSGVRDLNGGKGGIRNAALRATTIVNSYGVERDPITIASVEFAVNRDGPYMNQTSAEAAPANIRFLRVTTQTETVGILFGVRALGTAHTESRSAVAGMSVGINSICDFFPIAVALNPTVEAGDDPKTGYPAPDTVMTLTFVQGTGNSATLADKNYIILEVPDINGNGAPETAVLSAGTTSICQSLNANIDFHMTPSSNINNGPRQISDGVNTRFNMYAGGYGNDLNATNFPPDSNVQENINYHDYSNEVAGKVTPPNPNAPGVSERRILIAPIVDPGTYSPPRAIVKKWGAFFLKKVVTVQNPCSKAGNICAQLEVEWIDETLVLGRGFFDPNIAETSLTIPVLYK